MYVVAVDVTTTIWATLNCPGKLHSVNPRVALTSPLSSTRKGSISTYVGDYQKELEDFQCAICYSVIFQPILTTPCGHLFCKQCIEDSKKIRNDCPTCRYQNFATAPEGFVARKIGGISVMCPNAGRGCTWKGTLGESEDHLNNRCDYEEIQCVNCEHRGDRKEVNCLHPTWCEAFPLRCPNQPGCRAMITRATLENHLERCPEQLLECEFAPAGCTMVVSRKNLTEHLRVDAKRHDRLWKERIQQLSDMVLTSEMNTAGDDSSEIGGGICYRPWLCNPYLKEQPTHPHILTIDCQSTSTTGRFEGESNPFYSHAGGYKFQLHVVVSFDRGNTYISASVHLLEGNNDNNLMFPFKGTLTLSLMNQRMDREHQEKVLQLDPQFCRKENRGTMQDRFLSILPLCRWKESSSRAPCYIVDGRLYIKVSSVDFDRDYMSSCVHV